MAVNSERWGTKTGVILAVAGSAVGLGNFLRFPVQAAKYGEGAFMIPYLVALILVGVPLVWVEWTAGRFGGGFGHNSAPGIFQSLWQRNPAIKYIGVLGIFGPFLIYMYYVYIESWCLAYAYYSITGQLSNIASSEGFVSFLSGYQGVSGEVGTFAGTAPGFIFFLITFALNMTVIYFGIKGGIEKICNIALPLLFIFGIILAIRVITLFAPDPLNPDWSSINGLGFLWNADFSALKSAKVWMAAAGQVFFTLSVGMGVILTYASYLRKKDDVALSGLAAASTNQFAEVVVAGSLVIPAAFIFFGPGELVNIANSGGFNLGFVTMPQIFNQIPLGAILCFLWFFMLFLAGITSSISIVQPSVAFLESEYRLSREKAVKIFGIVSFILCQPAIWFMHRGVLDDLDFWGSNFVIVLGATIEIILLSWVFGIGKAWKELHVGSMMRVPIIFRFIIKYITPVGLLVLLGWWFATEWWSVITMKGISSEQMPYVLGARLLLFTIFTVMCYMVYKAWKKKRISGEIEETK